MPSEFDTEVVQAWARIVRDFAITGVGVFCFVYGGITVRDPTLLALFFGAGGALFGVPPYLRRNGNNGNGGQK